VSAGPAAATPSLLGGKGGAWAGMDGLTRRAYIC
jgi:hypothetical protein